MKTIGRIDPPIDVPDDDGFEPMIETGIEMPAPAGWMRSEGGERCDAAPRGDGWARFAAALDAGVDAALARDAAEALRRFDEAAAALAPTAGDAYARVILGVNRAQALLLADDPVGAEREAAAALRLARREKNDGWAALASFGIALVFLARGRLADARARLGEASRGFARAGDRLRQVQCHYVLGEIAYFGEDPIRAGSHYRDGLSLAREDALQEWIELLTSRFEHR